MKRIYMNVSDRGACAHYRAILPSRHFKVKNAEIVCSEEFMGEDFDVFIFHRIINPQYLSWIDKLKKDGKKIVLEFDDDFWNIPSWNPASVVIGEGEITLFNWLCDNVDEIWVSTHDLKEVVNRRNVKVLPNLLDLDEWNFQRTYDDKVKIVWAGSIHHEEDLKLLSPVVSRLISHFKDKIEISFFGSYPLPLLDWLPVRFTNYAAAAPKRRFGDSLKFVEAVELKKYPAALSAMNVDIGLCPLTDHKFNKSKSNLKFLEYTMVGAAVVASDMSPYQCIDDELDGFLVNTPAEWFERIKELVEDSEKRKKMNLLAREKVLRDYSWSSGRTEWADAFQSLIPSYGA